MIHFETSEKKDYTTVEISLDGPISPEELEKLKAPEVDCTKGVVLSGRAPIWLYGFMIHQYHPTSWVACFDPRLGGAVVVASHTKNVKEGEVISMA